LGQARIVANAFVNLEAAAKQSKPSFASRQQHENGWLRLVFL